MKRLLTLGAAMLFLVAPSALACTMNLTLENGRDRTHLKWGPVGASPADTYIFSVLERARTGNVSDWRSIGSIGLRGNEAGDFTFFPSSTVAQEYEYLVIATDQPDGNFVCMGRLTGVVQANPALAPITNRKIVPVAGSTPGVNGSQFRTSLTLHHVPLVKGRVYFRPAGTVASASDPFISYDFGDNGTEPSRIHYDDVVAAMGATGIGSLEIVPDPTSRPAVPEIEVRVYNVTPGGTFGSRVPAVWIGDWIPDPDLTEPQITLLIPPVEPRFRRNVGFRTLTNVAYRITIRKPGEPVRSIVGRTAPANVTYFASLDEFVGEPVSHDTRVTVSFFSGYAIGFRTETENFTNDPTVVISDPRETQRDLELDFSGR